jgi:hypothetical protein
MKTEHDAVRLRRYACLCARYAAHVAKMPLPNVVLVAERFAAGMASIEELKAAHAHAKARATAAGVVGLPRCAPSAAADLSALHTAGEDAATAAYWAGEFAVKAALFREAQIRSAGWHWPEDEGETWRGSWRAAEWLKRHRHQLRAVENAARATLRDMAKSALAPADAGRVLPFTHTPSSR